MPKSLGEGIELMIGLLEIVLLDNSGKLLTAVILLIWFLSQYFILKMFRYTAKLK